MFRFWWVFLLGAFGAQNALAELNYSLSAIGTWGDFTRETETAGETTQFNYGPNLGWGFGTSIGIPLPVSWGGDWGLDIGASLIRRSFTLESKEVNGNLNVDGLGNEQTYEMSYAQFPVLIRYWPIPYFSGGIGFYYAWLLGTIHFETRKGDRTSKDLTPADFSISESDFGGTISAAGHYPLHRRIHIFLDLRQNIGIINVSSDSATSRFREFQVILGARIYKTKE